MPRRVKEEERIEMIIRGLLKQQENRRCINCNSLGPQYVCTTFWTFVCTNCSGVHREFTHRVKSVSMAKFNEEEIIALQAGGNERARQIYFKTWDPQRNCYPDSSNLQRLREFVNHVYIERKYSGENSSNKLSMVKLDSRNNSCEWPSFKKSSWGRRDDFLERASFERTSNSGRDDIYDRSSFEKSSPCKRNQGLNLRDFLEERSPRYSQENGRSNSHRNRPTTSFEIVDDRFRDDGSVKHYERHSKKESRAGSRSPGSQNTATNLPAIRPVEVILGEKVPVLRIAGPPKANDVNDAEGSAIGQNAADATIPGPTCGNKKQYTTANSSSLIDFFDAKPEPISNPAEPQAQLMASDSNDESGSVASSTTQVAAIVPNMNSVESLLFELSASVTSSPSAGTSQVSAGATAAQLNSPKGTDVGTTKSLEISNSFGALANTIIKNGQPLHNNNTNPMVQDTQIHQLPSKQQSQTFVSPPGNTNSNTQQTATSVESLSNQQWNKSPPSNELRPVQSVPLEQPSQAADPGEGSKPSARKEIPQDIFTSNFTSFTPSVAGWQMHPPHGGYGMQFHPPAMSAAAFPNPPKPKNPFDIGDDRFHVQAATFPSMSSLQGALPNMPTSTALESQPSPYATALSSHVSPYGMHMPLAPGAYMGQMPNNMPLTNTRPQENANFGRSEDAFASLNPIQQASGTDSLPAAPKSPLSRVGNPFG